MEHHLNTPDLRRIFGIARVRRVTKLALAKSERDFVSVFFPLSLWRVTYPAPSIFLFGCSCARLSPRSQENQIDSSNLAITLDVSHCTECSRCVTVCREISGMAICSCAKSAMVARAFPCRSSYPSLPPIPPCAISLSFPASLLLQSSLPFSPALSARRAIMTAALLRCSPSFPGRARSTTQEYPVVKQYNRMLVDTDCVGCGQCSVVRPLAVGPSSSFTVRQ